MTGIEILQNQYIRGDLEIDRFEYLLEKWLKKEARVLDMLSINQNGCYESKLEVIPYDELNAQ